MPPGFATFFNALGANQRDLSQPLTLSLVWPRENPKGKTPCGQMSGSADFGWATIFALQNGHDPATSGGSNWTAAPQEEQSTCIALLLTGASSPFPAA
jgi:hypothetical protein